MWMKKRKIDLQIAIANEFLIPFEINRALRQCARKIRSKRQLMTNKIIAAFIVLLLISCNGNQEKQKEILYNNELLQRVRAAATAIPGALPNSIGYIKFAESRRKESDMIEDGKDDTVIMARTAFQIQYADGFVMVDAGMDRDVHKFFEKNGPQPFDAAKADSVRLAVEAAKLIVVTHEHGDHVAGVVRTAATGNIPRKTILTKQQVESLISDPQMPEIKLTADRSRQYIVADFEDILAVAPGVVMIKAPGHTKGEVMIYTKLYNGQEYLFVGDVTWSYKGVTDAKPKPASERKRLKEDSEMVESQLKWISALMKNERFTVLVSHDNVMLPQFVTQGLLVDGIRTK